MTATHNHAPQTLAELTTAERSALTMDKLNEWRATQHATLHNIKFGNGQNSFNLEWQADFDGGVDDSLDMFLEQSGIANDSANFSEVRQLFRDASIDKISEDEWGNSPASRGEDPNDHQTQSDVFQERISQRIGTQPTNSNRLSPEQVAEFEPLETAVEAAREVWAAESAKRQGRFFSLSRPSKKQQSLREDYFAKVQALGQRHLLQHADYSEEQKNLIATTILFDEQEKLRQLTTEKLEDKRISKIITWMNKGKWYTRIGKGVAIGAGAGVAGSFLAGAVGAGIIAGGAVAATRFARGFAMKDHDERGVQAYEDVIDVDENRLNIQTQDESLRMKLIDSSIGVNNDFEKDTRREQSKRRKAAIYGVGSMAVGSFLGYGIHEIIERASDANLSATHWINAKWNNFWNVDSGSGPGYADTTTGSGHHGTGGDHSGNGSGNHHDVMNFHEVNHNARTVVPSEGWYQTFNELGIPQEDWQNVLQDAGPRLHEQGWAYRMPDGQWGISQPGRLPDSALRVIAESSKDNGYKLAA